MDEFVKIMQKRGIFMIKWHVMVGSVLVKKCWLTLCIAYYKNIKFLNNNPNIKERYTFT